MARGVRRDRARVPRRVAGDGRRLPPGLRRRGERPGGAAPPARQGRDVSQRRREHRGRQALIGVRSVLERPRQQDVRAVLAVQPRLLLLLQQEPAVRRPGVFVDGRLARRGGRLRRGVRRRHPRRADGRRAFAASPGSREVRALRPHAASGRACAPLHGGRFPGRGGALRAARCRLAGASHEREAGRARSRIRRRDHRRRRGKARAGEALRPRRDG